MNISAPGQLVLAIIAVISIGIAAFYGFRFTGGMKAAADAAEAWRRERDAELAHRLRLEEQLERANEKIERLEAQVDELNRRPSLESIERALERHEERAEIRAERMLTALDALVSRVQPHTE